MTAPASIAPTAPSTFASTPAPATIGPMFRRLWTTESPAARRTAVGLLLAAATALYVTALSINGYANSFYSAAIQAGAHSWRAWLWGASDWPGTITVDKPPASLWIPSLFVRFFGLNSWSVLLPEALMGVATAYVMYRIVRMVTDRWQWGIVAGAGLLLVPVATLMFRFNNPDALMLLLQTMAAWGVLGSIKTGKVRWFALAGVALGFAFLAKQLQGLLPVPILGLAYLIFARKRAFVRRIVDSLLAIAALVVSGGWWVALTMIVSDRPWIGGSQNNSFWELTFGYNGLGRLNGNETGSVGGGGAGGAGAMGGMGAGTAGSGTASGTASGVASTLATTSTDSTTSTLSTVADASSTASSSGDVSSLAAPGGMGGGGGMPGGGGGNPGGGGGSMGGGNAGLSRLFQSELAGQISWFIPAMLIVAIAAWVMWFTWGRKLKPAVVASADVNAGQLLQDPTANMAGAGMPQHAAGTQMGANGHPHFAANAYTPAPGQPQHAAYAPMGAGTVPTMDPAALEQERSERNLMGAALFVTFGWFLITAVIFSLMAGIFHAYYTVALSVPVVLTLVVAAGIVARRGGQHAWGIAGVGIILTGLMSAYIFNQNNLSAVWSAVAILGSLVAGGVCLFTGYAPAAARTTVWKTKLSATVAAVLLAVGLGSTLTPTAAWSVNTAATSHTGSIVSASFRNSSSGGPGGGRGGAGGRMGQGGIGTPPGTGGSNGSSNSTGTGTDPFSSNGSGSANGFGGQGMGSNGSGSANGNSSSTGTNGAESAGGNGNNMGALINGAEVSDEVKELMIQDADQYTWVAAAVGSQTAASYQLALDHAVIAVGGFNGSDPWPSLDYFKQLVEESKIHYWIPGGGFGGSNGGSNVSSEINSWVQENFTSVTVGNTTLYDLTQPADNSSGDVSAA